MANVPNFMIIGGTRCGTSSLRKYIKEHPDVYFSKKKGLFFFNNDKNYCNGLSEYEKEFEGACGEKIIAEATPMYFEKGAVYDTEGILCVSDNKDSIERIKKHIPDVKVLVSLRNPVDKYISEYQKAQRQGKKFAQKTIDKQFEKDLIWLGAGKYNMLYNMKYKTHLENVVKALPRENIKVVIFEHWTKDTVDHLKRIYDFLGIDNSFNSDIYNKIFCSRNDFKKKSAFNIFNLFKKDVNLEREGLSDEMKQRLYAFCKEDIEYVEEFLSVKLPEWHM